jgi:HK97 family phage prohead protease
METRNINCNRRPQIVARSGGQRRLRGYGAMFYNPNDSGTQYELWPGLVERIARGAFAGLLAGDIRILHNHDSSRVLGRTSAGTAEVGVDSIGLWYSVALGDSTIARDVEDAVRRGDLDGSSFAFVPGKMNTFFEGDVEVMEHTQFAQVLECSVCAFPAYASTSAEMRKRAGVTGRQPSEDRTAYMRRVAASLDLSAPSAPTFRTQAVEPAVDYNYEPRPGETRAQFRERSRRAAFAQFWISANRPEKY